MPDVITLLTNEKEEFEFPIINSTIGENAVDISSLYKKIGLFTFDPGFVSTASCKSAITFIDGDNGILMHRGYDIKDLAENSTFTEVFFALLYGDLPSKSDLQHFTKSLISKMELDEEVKNLIKTFDKHKSHPMAIMMGAISSLSAKYGNLYSPSEAKSIEDTAIDLVAKVCTIAAFVFRYTNDLDLSDFNINTNFTFEQNLVNIMFEGTNSIKHFDTLVSAFNKILILHADHEQNASTSTVRLVASTDANIYASVVAGFAALWGPLHGGANEAVIEMLHEIKEVSNIPDFISKAKDKNSGIKLMGFGHRVYKNYDPRAAVLKSSCDAILSAIQDESSETLKIAESLEKIALQDDYFIQRKLFPNVDFYSGIIYKALGIQSNFFTVIFGMARTAGWVSQVLEAMLDENKKISRPRQVYVGEKNKKIKL